MLPLWYPALFLNTSARFFVRYFVWSSEFVRGQQQKVEGIFNEWKLRQKKKIGLPLLPIQIHGLALENITINRNSGSHDCISTIAHGPIQASYYTLIVDISIEYVWRPNGIKYYTICARSWTSDFIIYIVHRSIPVLLHGQCSSVIKYFKTRTSVRPTYARLGYPKIQII